MASDRPEVMRVLASPSERQLQPVNHLQTKKAIIGLLGPFAELHIRSNCDFRIKHFERMLFLICPSTTLIFAGLALSGFLATA